MSVARTLFSSLAVGWIAPMRDGKPDTRLGECVGDGGLDCTYEGWKAVVAIQGQRPGVRLDCTYEGWKDPADGVPTGHSRGWIAPMRDGKVVASAFASLMLGVGLHL